jgi:hypothetical protein
MKKVKVSFLFYKNLILAISKVNYRFIVYEFKSNSNENNNKNNEDNFDYRLKMHNPMKVYLQDGSEKMRKFALEQIVSGVYNVDEKRIEKAQKALSNKHDLYNQDRFYSPDEFNEIISVLESRITSNKSYNFSEKEIQNHNEFMKMFASLCENNKIITIDQKIDYYVYLRSSNVYNYNNFGKDSIRKNNHKLTVKQQSKVTTVSNSKTKKSLLENDKNSAMKINLASKVNNEGMHLNFKENSHRKSNYNINKSFEINLESILVEEVTLSKLIKDSNVQKIKLNNSINNEDNEDLNYNNNKNTDKLFNDIKFRLLNVDPEAQLSKLTYQDKIKYLNNYSEISPNSLILKDISLTLSSLQVILSKRLFSFKQLLVLNLTRNNLNDNECSIILHMIASYSNNLEILNLSYNILSIKSVQILSKMLSKSECTIKSLNLNGTKIGDQNFSELCLGFSKNLYLSKLWLADIDLGKIGIIILGTVLRYDKKIVLLDLSSNKFNDDCLVYVFKGLISNTCLRVLYLNSLKLTKNSINILETSMIINNYLKELYFENNNLNNKSCEIFVKILNKNRSLELISIINNNIDNDGIDIITDKYKSFGKIKILSKSEENLRKINQINKKELLQYVNSFV